MKIIFAGTPAFAAEALEALVAQGHEIALVLTQPDRPAGRGRKLRACEVKEVALKHGLPVLSPVTLRASRGLPETAEALAAMRAAHADLLVVAAYGLILPQVVLDIARGVLPEKFPTLKAVNIHGSLLPAWRGAAPIARGLQAGDRQAGVTLMQMDAGLDTGPMLYRKGLEVSDEDTAGTLTEKVAKLGAQMLIEYLRAPEQYPPIAQPEGATYAHKLAKAESPVDWRRPAAEVACQIRAFNPFPGSTARLGDMELKLWSARSLAESTQAAPGTVVQSGRDGLKVACGAGSVVAITELQKPGGKKLSAAQFLLGTPIAVGDVFSERTP